MRALWFTPLVLWGILHGQPAQVNLEDPGQDFVFAELEPYSDFKSHSSLNQNSPQYWRVADQISFPAGHLYGHFLFGTFKNTFIDRDIAYNGLRLNGGLLQRYWLSGGIMLQDAPRHSSYFIVGAGLNSDFADIGTKDWNTEWIYGHSFVLSPTFQLGMGLDVQQYFDKLAPYPLIFLKWRFSPNTKLMWDADYLELRHFLAPRLAVTAGMRFNLEFFALKHDASYEYQSTGAEAGLQYSLGRHCYVRFKYKELIWGREYLGLPNGDVHRTWIRSGRSLRLNLAYGI